MRPLALIILTSLLFSACTPGLKKASIKIDSTPPAIVYIDDKEAGTTTYENRSLSPGYINVKLVSQSDSAQTWSKQIKIQNNINTVVKWNFADDKSDAFGYILYLEKTGQDDRVGLLANATPDRTTVEIDGETKGFTPLRLDNIGFGDKTIHFSYPGYKNIDVVTREVRGYQLVVESFLGKVIPITIVEPSATPSPIENKTATIKSTPTGWLRVRASNSLSSREVKKIKPKQKYKILKTEDEWIQLDLGNNLTGWIMAKYADIL